MAAGFKFRLQSVLDYRTGLVDRARQELASLQALLRDAELMLEALRQAEREALAELAQAQSATTLNLPLITHLLEYDDIIAQHIVEQQQVIDARRQAVDEQQQQLVALAKDAKALEKLRERQLEEYAQEDARRERIETSEIAAMRHQRLQVTRS